VSPLRSSVRLLADGRPIVCYLVPSAEAAVPLLVQRNSDEFNSNAILNYIHQFAVMPN
jgi:hypothetical protein